MKSRMRPALACLTIGIVAVLAALAVRDLTRGPDVLLITIDTTRADHLGCYGYAAAQTPTLDSLAAEGVLFEDASASAPVTLPSHASLLTGLHPPRHGLRDNGPPLPLPRPGDRPFQTLAEVLKGHGYQTAAFVSATPLAAKWGLDSGFDVYDGPEIQRGGDLSLTQWDGARTAGRAVGWLGRRDRSKPFFLWVHLFDPHQPYAAPNGSGAPPDSIRAYDEEIAFADAQVSRLVDLLRSEGSLDRTLVVATSDHGEGLGDHGEQTHGYLLHRSTLRVPLLMRFPARFHAGTRVETPVSLTDVLPTVLRSLGRPLPEHPLDGLSLTDMEAYTGERPDGALQYAESLYGWRTFRWAQGCAVRQGSLRTIDWGGGRRRVYDVVADPAEENDLADEQGAAVQGAVEAAWSLFTAAPLASAKGTADEDPFRGLPYLGGSPDLHALALEANAALPTPDAGFIVRFSSALRMLDRAEALGSTSEARGLAGEAIDALATIEKEAPQNPAVAFWLGRAWQARATLYEGTNAKQWSEAFFWFRRAGERGYDRVQTSKMMIKCALLAGQPQEALKVAVLAHNSGVRGDAAFWCLATEAFIEGGERDSAGRLVARERNVALECLGRARELRPSEEETRWIDDLEARIQ